MMGVKDADDSADPPGYCYEDFIEGSARTDLEKGAF